MMESELFNIHASIINQFGKFEGYCSTPGEFQNMVEYRNQLQEALPNIDCLTIHAIESTMVDISFNGTAIKNAIITLTIVKA